MEFDAACYSRCGLAHLVRGDSLLACLHCNFVGCWSPHWREHAALGGASGRHLQMHLASSGTHWLGVDVVHPERLYCARCADFVYDARFVLGGDRVGCGFHTPGERKKRRYASPPPTFDDPLFDDDVLSTQSRFQRPAHHHYDEGLRGKLSAAGWLGRCRAATVPALTPITDPDDDEALSSHGLRGVHNMGNTCFMSCILQVLLHNPAFQAFFLHGGHARATCRRPPAVVETADLATTAGRSSPAALAALESRGSHACLACELAEVFAAAFGPSSLPPPSPSSSEAVVVPHRMLYATWCFDERLSGYEQHDAHEFLMTLLHALATHLEDVVVEEEAPPAITAPQQSPDDDNSATTKYFNNNNNNNNSNAVGVPPSVEVEAKPLLLVPVVGGVPPVSPNDDGDTAAATKNGHVADPSLEGFINEVFCGRLRSDVVCTKCGATSSTREPFLDLSLALGDLNHARSSEATTSKRRSTSPAFAPVVEQPEAGGAGNKMNGTPPPTDPAAEPPLKLQDCLDRFTCAETLADPTLCAACGEVVERRKQLALELLPNVLIVHLKRFDALRERKIRCAVDFPVRDVLDLGPFLAPWRLAPNGTHTTETKAPPHEYRLAAVVNHTGDLGQGHYTCFVKEGGEWYLCDDSTVRPVDAADVAESEGYILFYVRSDLANQAPARSSFSSSSTSSALSSS